MLDNDNYDSAWGHCTNDRIKNFLLHQSPFIKQQKTTIPLLYNTEPHVHLMMINFGTVLPNILTLTKQYNNNEYQLSFGYLIAVP